MSQGPSGCGKTVSTALLVVEAMTHPNLIVLSRFVGVTSSASHTVLMLRSLCQQLGAALAQPTDVSLMEPAELKHLFASQLTQATADQVCWRLPPIPSPIPSPFSLDVLQLLTCYC